MTHAEQYQLQTQRITKVITACTFLVLTLAIFFFAIRSSMANPDPEPKFDISSLNSTKTQGKYAVAMSSTTINGKIQTHITILNTETGKSKFHQLFFDYGKWKVVELSSPSIGLDIPQANF